MLTFLLSLPQLPLYSNLTSRRANLRNPQLFVRYTDLYKNTKVEGIALFVCEMEESRGYEIEEEVGVSEKDREKKSRLKMLRRRTSGIGATDC